MRAGGSEITEGAGARLAPAGGGRLRNLAAVCAAGFAIGFAVYFGYALVQIAQRPIAGLSAPNDASVFWAAARLALEGRPEAAFDLAALTEARNLPPWTGEAGKRMSWLYPPHFHALIVPLGLLPFGAAWLAFAIAGMAAFWLGLRRLVPDRAAALIALASPAVLICVIHGQNSLIVGGLLAGFLGTLRDRQSVSAGVLLGWLTVKPQFGPLLPLALAVRGEWRVIGWATASAVAIGAATLLWTGPGYWLLFFQHLAGSIERVDSAWLPRHLMVTWYAFARAVALPQSWASGLQLTVTLAIAAAVCWAWWRPGVAFARRAAVLTLAIPLATPYAYFYDLVIPMIGVALLLGTLAPGDVLRGGLIGLVWALPSLGHFGREIGYDGAFAVLGAPVLTLALGALLIDIARAAPARAEA